jgi:hypothetical protein
MTAMREIPMAEASPGDSRKANQATATDCGKTRNALRLTASVMQAAQALWPRKTAAELSMRAGTGVRACEYWLSRRTEMSADALAELIRSDAGLEILEAIIGDARPVWWKHFARTIEMSRLRKAQDESRRRLERLELDL